MILAHEVNIDDVDHWAVDLVVREGVKMNLTYSEKLVAVRDMWRMGLRSPQMADRLRVRITDIDAMMQRLRRMREIDRHDGTKAS